MKETLLDYIKIYPNLASKGLCNTVIDYYKENANWKPSEFSTSTGKSPMSESRVKMNDFWIGKPNKYYEELKTVFFSGVDLYIKEFPRIIPEGSTPFRINHYPKDGFMVPHIDNIHHSHGQKWGYPHITSLLFLNDDYEGGRFVMCDGKWSAPKSQGSVIVFPSNFMYPHGVEKVIQGDRYTIMTWII